jgi:hypothetical protein
MKASILCAVALLRYTEGRYTVNAPASNASGPYEAFVSFSIEFSSFPDFAGKYIAQL